MFPGPLYGESVRSTLQFFSVGNDPVRLLEYNPNRILAWIAESATANTPPTIARTPAALVRGTYPYPGNNAFIPIWGPEEVWAAQGSSGTEGNSDVFVHAVYRD